VGLFLFIATLAWAGGVAADVVINEIHYAPDVKTEPVEFIELYNQATNGVDLSGWRFTHAVEFTFPGGTMMAPGAFLVVARNPAALQAKFRVTALGPWSGKLSNRGDRIVLADGAGRVEGEVEYKLGFPWPTVGDPPGYSIELINPSVDNNLGGHWRASVTDGGGPASTLVLDSGATWKFRKGTNAPPADWRAYGFDDSGWDQGVAPIGYDPNIKIGTPLADMRGNYLSVFLRGSFGLTNADEVTGLTLEALYDDGFKMWINGQPITDVNMPPGDVPFDQPALSVIENDNFVAVNTVLPAGTLRNGQNVVAIQQANGNLGASSDCFFDCRLRTVTGGGRHGPTPGQVNSVFAAHVPAAVRQVQHAPQQPHSAQPVIVSAKVTSADGVAAVVLQYQLVDPGAYLPLSDPAYAANWTAVPMNDAGLDGDAAAGDDVFTVTLPDTLQQHRRLVRYRLVATDRSGATVQAPYPDDPEPNFAYFCYDGVPAWSGAVRPGVTSPFTVGAAEMNRLPVYHLIARRQAVEDCTWYDRSHGDEYFWLGTIVYDGHVYDHIRFRPRGGVWRYAMGKNMWKFDFNRGHDFEPRDDWGRAFDTAWTKLNLSACIQQGDYLHRGEQGMFESVGFRLFQLVGEPAMNTAFVQFRIIDDAEESQSSNQYVGDFWGLYLAVEQPDGRFLDEHGLPDGNLYKMEGGYGEPNNLGPDGPVDSSDLTAFMNSYSGTTTSAWWQTNLDLASYYSYQSIIQAIHHYDIADGKNYFYYRNPEDQRWWVFPWDLDLTWADNMYRSGQQGGDEPFKSRLLSNFSRTPKFPDLARAFRNRVREVRDLLWNQDEAFKLIDEYARLVRGTNASSIIDADRAQWDYNPIMVNSSIVIPSKAGQGLYYQSGAGSKDFSGMVRLMKNYVGYRATNATFSLDTMASETGLPAQPTLTYTGPPGFGANKLAFRASAFSGSAFASIKWRLAEITLTNQPTFDATEPEHYEITPTWESPELTSPDLDFAFPPGLAKVAHLYRVRVRYTDTTGRTSHWSLPVELTAGTPDNPEDLEDYLRLSELMYNPPQGNDFEFLEFHNRSDALTLDLSGLKFTDGIDFTFPAGTQLPPNAYLVLVRAATNDNFATFRAGYHLDATVPIVGPYSGSLANDGELLTLKTAANGSVILSFTYSDGRGWALAADGAGHSLVPLTRTAQGQEGQYVGSLDYGGNWRASVFIGGSPGRVDPGPIPSLMLNEIMAHTVYANPVHPEYDSNDWIELVNAGPASSLAHYYLSDDKSNLKKWALPAVDVSPGGLIAFDEVTGFHSPITNGFGLNHAGEELFLSYLPGTDQDRVSDAVAFKGQEREFSWGRDYDRRPYWERQAPTPGQMNQGPVPAPAINEIMYWPWGVIGPTNWIDSVHDEFIELSNPLATPVALFDTNGAWRLDGGAKFLFPPTTTIPAHGYLLLVSFNPTNATRLAVFRQRFGITNDLLAILGPYEGALARHSDRVALEKPVAPDLPGEPYAWAIVDEVIYSSETPWPVQANYLASLQRGSEDRNGNDPNSWFAGFPTAGASNYSPSRSDWDGDGLPDAWESAYSLNPTDPTGDYGADGDPDGDGFNNREEYLAGTDPRRPTLWFTGAELSTGSVHLRFKVPAGLRLELQVCDTAAETAWQVLAAFPSQPTVRTETWTDDAPRQSPQRFYRLFLPGQ
jgi:hypothetical protein